MSKQVTGADWQLKLEAALPHHGTYTAVNADNTANAATIDTGRADATVFVVQVYRSNVNVTGDAAISMAAGVLTVADGASTYAVTAGDVINWIVV